MKNNILIKISMALLLVASILLNTYTFVDDMLFSKNKTDLEEGNLQVAESTKENQENRETEIESETEEEAYYSEEFETVLETERESYTETERETQEETERETIRETVKELPIETDSEDVTYITENEVIPYKTIRKHPKTDGAQTRIAQAGKNGLAKNVYKAIYDRSGNIVSQELVESKSSVIEEPVDEIIETLVIKTQPKIIEVPIYEDVETITWEVTNSQSGEVFTFSSQAEAEAKVASLKEAGIDAQAVEKYDYSQEIVGYQEVEDPNQLEEVEVWE